MSNGDSSFILRNIVGFVFSPIVPSVLYAWHSWGEAFFPMVYFVIFVAYLLTFFVMLPLYLVVMRNHFFNVYSSSLLSFGVLFSIFLVFYIAVASGYNSLTVGGEVLVEGGRITAEGYLRSLMGAFVVGLFGMLGGIIFAIFVRGRKIFSASCV